MKLVAEGDCNPRAWSISEFLVKNDLEEPAKKQAKIVVMPFNSKKPKPANMTALKVDTKQ